MSFTRFSLVFALVVSFAFNAYARISGAGVWLVFEDNTTMLAKEPRKRYEGNVQTAEIIEVWSEFGGGVENNESPAEAAYRELMEETGHTTFNETSDYNIQLSHIVAAEENGHFFDRTTRRNNTHRCYFLRIPGDKPDVEKIKKNAKAAEEQYGEAAKIEKNEWRYFALQDIWDAEKNSGILPREAGTIYDQTLNMIQQPEFQKAFQNFLDKS